MSDNDNSILLCVVIVFCTEVSCNDVNNCDVNADCTYDHSSSNYQCQCRSGFRGDGYSCTDSGNGNIYGIYILGFGIYILGFGIYILGFGTFSDGVGSPRHNIHSPGVLMKVIGAEFLRLDALPGVNHMCRMQYKIVLNITFWPELN